MARGPGAGGGDGRLLGLLGPPAFGALCGWEIRFPYANRCPEKSNGTLILTSLLEDLVSVKRAHETTNKKWLLRTII